MLQWGNNTKTKKEILEQILRFNDEGVLHKLPNSPQLMDILRLDFPFVYIAIRDNKNLQIRMDEQKQHINARINEALEEVAHEISIDNHV
jgi:hypothetical protein